MERYTSLPLLPSPSYFQSLFFFSIKDVNEDVIYTLATTGYFIKSNEQMKQVVNELNEKTNTLNKKAFCAVFCSVCIKKYSKLSFYDLSKKQNSSNFSRRIIFSCDVEEPIKTYKLFNIREYVESEEVREECNILLSKVGLCLKHIYQRRKYELVVTLDFIKRGRERSSIENSTTESELFLGTS